MTEPRPFSLPVFTPVLVLLLTLFLSSCAPPSAWSRSQRQPFALSRATITGAEKRFGSQAGKDLRAWVALINNDRSRTDKARLEKVNAFFNRFVFVSDGIHWGRTDYWATPVEFIASGGGDCEDFAIAKYFTLRSLGVADSRLNITYVKALRQNMAHMVLAYYASRGAEPLILDNLIKQIKPASKRRDLLPIYSFNGSSMWIVRETGRGKRVGSSSGRLSMWRQMLRRMPQELKQRNL